MWTPRCSARSPRLLALALKTNGFRQGQISPRRDGSGVNDPWRCEGNWNDNEGGTSISCKATPKATADGLVFELSIRRTDVGALISIYPGLERWQEYGGSTIIDDEIGCVWARLDAAPTEAGPDAPADGGIGPDLAPDMSPQPVPGTWVAIPAGRFTMGSLPSDACYESNQDQHDVTLTNAFEMQDTEVTQEQFAELMGYNPAAFTTCGIDCPVEMVNWHEAVAYCNALSGWAGLATCYQCSGGGTDVTCGEVSPYDGQNIYTCPGYRLPTEAEWEYAYRAGSTSGLYNGPSDRSACHACSDSTADGMAWYICNSSGTTHPVKQKDPNQWMLYDMAGNVWEWCHDWYSPNLGSAAVTDPWGPPNGPEPERLVRGGGWGLHAYTLRAAFRNEHVDPMERSWNSGHASFGFRCVRSLGL
ncbi:MAG: formylglycine-generating enzyme family protein [Lentisphaeria bacterium]|nr:formylglycine-generating enzyme family protein [Lentisphaeria bacterium]